MLVDDVIRSAFSRTSFLVDHLHTFRHASWTEPGRSDYLYLGVVLSGDIPVGADILSWQLSDEPSLEAVADALVADAKAYADRLVRT